ncbi:MAG: TIGR01777 family oxidoreductase [Bradymonadaceae bacterium]
MRVKHMASHQSLRVAVSGSSGTVGRALCAFLSAEGHEVRRLVRKKDNVESDCIYWSPAEGVIDHSGLEGIDAVVHLAGENIGEGRWTKEKRRRIMDSRVLGTSLLAHAVAELESPPGVFISASAVGYYGDRGDEVLTEESSLGEGFLAEVCRAWEEAALPAREAGIRTVNTRFGVILEPDSGALERMVLSSKLGLTSRLGSGEQFMSWVDLEDVVRAIVFVLTHDELEGPINVTSPNPVRNKDFMATVAKAVNRPALVAAPAFAIKAVMGSQAAEETALVSQRALPARLEEAGFTFLYPELKDCLRTRLT